MGQEKNTGLFLISQNAKTIRLNKGQPLTIGREKYNDIVLNDLLVSRQHAVIQWKQDHFEFKDLNSRNGSLYNGERVHVAKLKDGDVLKIGGYAFNIRAASQMDIEKMLLHERVKMASQETMVDADLGIRFSDKGFTGDLQTLALVAIVQTLTQCLKTGLLTVKDSDNKKHELGRIYFEDGEFKHAVADNNTGFEAILEIMNLQEGMFEFQNDVTTDTQTIKESTMSILLEACRLRDESHRAETQS